MVHGIRRGNRAMEALARRCFAARSDARAVLETGGESGLSTSALPSRDGLNRIQSGCR
jgi:hypothetical protein